MTRKGAWRNILSHTMPLEYSASIAIFLVATESLRFLTQIRKLHLGQQKQWEKAWCAFSVYKCAWCDGWHIGKNAQNKIKSDALEDKALVSEDATSV